MYLRVSILLFVLFFLTHTSFSQDIEVYKKEKNDNYVLPNIHPEMTFEEFNLLSKNVKMKDMLYAVFVPGHVHFKASESKKGYWLIGIRAVSFATIGYALIDAEKNYGGLVTISMNNSDKVLYQSLIYGGLGIMTSTYLYDLIHGEYVLSQKQEKIRYKYAIQLKADKTTTFISNERYPAIALQINF